MLYGLFGYSRSERVGSLILIIVVTAIILSRLIIIGNKEAIAELPGNYKPVTSLIDSVVPAEAFEFDPNTVSFEDLIKLGLSTKQANTLINYRESGAVFTGADDFRKVYGISVAMQDSLIPYINISHRAALSIKNAEVSVREVYVEEYAAHKSEKVFIPVEINSADSIQLVTLPGIGEVLGPRIVKYRELLGGFHNIMQLSEVYGLDSAVVEAIRGYILIDTTLIRKIDINSADYKEIIRHPYTTKKHTEDILNYREHKGCILSFKDLLRNNILSKNDIDKFALYFSFCDSVIIDR